MNPFLRRNINYFTVLSLLEQSIVGTLTDDWALTAGYYGKWPKGY